MRPGVRGLLVAGLVGFMLAGACGGGGVPSAGGSPSSAGSSSAGPSDGSPATSIPSSSATGQAPSTWVIVLENHGYDAIVGSPNAPAFNALAQRYALLTNAEAIGHPSQPNYLAMWSGSTQGVTDDSVHDLSARTLADQLDAAGVGWRVFAENVPGGCFTGATASGGPDGAGTYARKHEPAISFTAVQADEQRCARIADFTAFRPDAAPFEFIVPNLCHDMHDCDAAQGDSWLGSFVPRILDSPAWRANGLLIVTFDEGEGSGNASASRIPVLVAAPWIAPGSRLGNHFDHYDLLRTIQTRYHLGCLAEACSASPYGALVGP